MRKIKFHTRKLISFSPKSIERLKELTLIGESQMRKAIENKNNDQTVITAKINNKLVAWCLIQKRYRHTKHSHAIIQVFVISSYRRNGIGSKLISRATNYIRRCRGFKKVICAPWNFESKKFFKATGFVCNKNDTKIWSKIC